jgi:hypothetical protein
LSSFLVYGGDERGQPDKYVVQIQWLNLKERESGIGHFIRGGRGARITQPDFPGFGVLIRRVEDSLPKNFSIFFIDLSDSSDLCGLLGDIGCSQGGKLLGWEKLP